MQVTLNLNSTQFGKNSKTKTLRNICAKEGKGQGTNETFDQIPELLATGANPLKIGKAYCRLHRGSSLGFAESNPEIQSSGMFNLMRAYITLNGQRYKDQISDPNRPARKLPPIKQPDIS